MAKIRVIHKVPDGNKCTILIPQTGDMICDAYEHCHYRTSIYIPDEKRAQADAAVKDGTYRSIDFSEVHCRLFGAILKIDPSDELPYKCKQCMEATI